MSPHPETVLITGASARVGLELAKESLLMGFHVVLHYRSSPEPAKTLFENDDRVLFIQSELTNSPEQLIDTALALPVKLIGLINNASVFVEGNISNPDHLQNILNVNVMVPVRLGARFAQAIPNGWIVNITDAHVDRPHRQFQNYRISKKLLSELTCQQAFLFAPSIRVNAIAPGAILPAAGDSDEKFLSLAQNIPLGRTGEVKHIRQAYRFLVENDYITGNILQVDGGWHL